MIDKILKSQKEWNKRLQQMVEKMYNSKASFTKDLNDKYRSEDEEKQFTWPTVRDWQRVGLKRGMNKATIGFPKFENMLMIADCLEVDIGFLIGETDSETFTLEKASDYLHLTPDALKNFSRITDKTVSDLPIEQNEYIYSTVLNKLFCSEHFEHFVESLKELEDTYAKYKGMIPNLSELRESDLDKAHLDFLTAKLSEKYGETILNQAWEYYGITCEDEDPFSLTDKEHDAEKEISNIPPFFLDIFIRSKSDWHTIVEKSLPMLKEMNEFSNKHGKGLLEKIWSPKRKPLGLTEEQKNASIRLYNIRHQFIMFLQKGYELRLSIFDLDLLTSLLKEIEHISAKYSEAVLEKAWEHYKVCEAIKDIKDASDKNDVFLAEFKKEVGYHRFLVQESLVLLLNNIYPTSVDLHNNFYECL